MFLLNSTTTLALTGIRLGGVVPGACKTKKHLLSFDQDAMLIEQYEEQEAASEKIPDHMWPYFIR